MHFITTLHTYYVQLFQGLPIDNLLATNKNKELKYLFNKFLIVILG